MSKIDVRARKISDTEWHLTGTIGEEAPAPAPAPSPARGQRAGALLTDIPPGGASI